MSVRHSLNISSRSNSNNNNNSNRNNNNRNNTNSINNNNNNRQHEVYRIPIKERGCWEFITFAFEPPNNENSNDNDTNEEFHLPPNINLGHFEEFCINVKTIIDVTNETLIRINGPAAILSSISICLLIAFVVTYLFVTGRISFILLLLWITTFVLGGCLFDRQKQYIHKCMIDALERLCHRERRFIVTIILIRKRYECCSKYRNVYFIFPNTTTDDDTVVGSDDEEEGNNDNDNNNNENDNNNLNENDNNNENHFLNNNSNSNNNGIDTTTTTTTTTNNIERGMVN